jgi:hypothetical protein
MKKLIIIIAILASVSPVMARTKKIISNNDAVSVILGEAGNQGYDGMLAVAGALRNRGATKGCYGKNNPIVNKQPEWARRQARKAWNESAHRDVTNGASFWGNKSDIDNNSFYKELTFTVKVKDHWFFKK